MTFNHEPPHETSSHEYELDAPVQSGEVVAVTRGVVQLDPKEDSGVWRTPARGTPTSHTLKLPWPQLVSLVRAQVRSLVGPSRDADDLTQAALEQIVRSIDRFEGRCELSTYTYRISSRVVMNHWRSLRRYFKRFVLGAEDVPEPVSTDPDTDPMVLLERQRAARLHFHLDRLSADHRLVVVLADLEELPASRIAEIIDCPENTVRSRLKRARAELLRRLTRDPLFGDDVTLTNERSGSGSGSGSGSRSVSGGTSS